MTTKTIQFICLTIAIFAVSFAFSSAAMAADESNLVVIFNPDPLFSEGNFMPGDTSYGTAEVGNNSGAEQAIAIEAINIVNDDVNGGKFGDALNLIIKENTTELFNNTLTEFFNRGNFFLSNVSNNASTTYEFFVYFDNSSENKYQEKYLGFDVLIGIEGEGTERCNYNGIQDNGETGIDCGGGGCPACGGNGGNGGNGGGGGGGLPPGLTIINESATSTTCTTATITWQTSYFSTSRVIYCRADDVSCIFDLSDIADDPSFYGYSSTTPEQDNSPKVTVHTVVIYNLAESTDYVYRCVSHASPATIGYEKSFTTPACPDKVAVLGEEGAPGLTISKQINVNFANPGDTVTYKVNITNNGNLTAYNAVLTDTLPSGFTFSNTSETSKTWQLGNMASGQTKGAEYDVVIDSSVASGIYANIAQVSADNHDTISASTDLEVRKIVVKGIELAPTGFSVKEFIILILTLVMIVGSVVVLRKRYL